MVTGNDGLNDNVASGTILNTPNLDLYPYSNPHIRFRYWPAFANDSPGATRVPICLPFE
ncbi:MAG: hypothetical protein IPP29_16790 [Bacteroidetes bacterium]|nr:hypothetical protein [Bacteroidota bacterium]